jgi:hypothetical protein
MPNFEMPVTTAAGSAALGALPTAARAYVKAIFWTSTGERDFDVPKDSPLGGLRAADLRKARPALAAATPADLRAGAARTAFAARLGGTFAKADLSPEVVRDLLSSTMDGVFEDLAPESLAEAVSVCDLFTAGADSLLGGSAWREGAKNARLAGHDFWLTRNGHGAGFWDGHWPEPAADVLTRLAHSFGYSDLYRGDDGKLYLQSAAR